MALLALLVEAPMHAYRMHDSSASVRALATGPRRDGATVRSAEPGGADRIDLGARRPRGVDFGFQAYVHMPRR